jgi:hypothetical protein
MPFFYFLFFIYLFILANSAMTIQQRANFTIKNDMIIGIENKEARDANPPGFPPPPSAHRHWSAELQLLLWQQHKS